METSLNRQLKLFVVMFFQFQYHNIIKVVIFYILIKKERKRKWQKVTNFKISEMQIFGHLTKRHITALLDKVVAIQFYTRKLNQFLLMTL